MAKQKCHNMMRVQMGFVLAAMLLLTACAQGPKAAERETEMDSRTLLTSGVWHLVILEGSVVPDDAGITLRFDDKGKMYGFTGCNNYFGTWNYADGVLSLGPMGTTMRACLDMEKETAYLQRMSKMQYVLRTEDDGLMLAPGLEATAEEILKFVRKEQAVK